MRADVVYLCDSTLHACAADDEPLQDVKVHQVVLAEKSEYFDARFLKSFGDGLTEEGESAAGETRLFSLVSNSIINMLVIFAST